VLPFVACFFAVPRGVARLRWALFWRLGSLKKKDTATKAPHVLSPLQLTIPCCSPLLPCSPFLCTADSDVAMNAVLALGFIGAGTNNARWVRWWAVCVFVAGRDMRVVWCRVGGQHWHLAHWPA